MADLARILALPSPRSFGAAAKPAGNQLRPIADARDAGRDSLALGLVAEGPEESAAQAKRFKFRIYDGVARGTPSADFLRDQASAASNRPHVETAESDRAGPSDRTPNQTAPKAVATFLAQLISQEQLGQGLHVPPLKAADLAYRRAGGEPRIDIGSPARFSLAV